MIPVTRAQATTADTLLHTPRIFRPAEASHSSPLTQTTVLGRVTQSETPYEAYSFDLLFPPLDRECCPFHYSLAYKEPSTRLPFTDRVTIIDVNIPDGRTCQTMAPRVIEIDCMETALTRTLTSIAKKRLNPAIFFQPLSHKKLTPLMLAAATKNHRALQFLANLAKRVQDSRCFAMFDGAKPLKPLDEQDSVGFSALHHAAANGDRIGMGILMRAGINTGLKNMWNGTAFQIYKMVSTPLSPPNDFGFSCDDQIRTTPLSAVKSWMLPVDYKRCVPSHVLRMQRPLLEKYAAYRASEPPIELCQTTHSSDEKKLPFAIGIGCSATRTISPGDVIGPYSGQMHYFPSRDEEMYGTYHMGDTTSTIDGLNGSMLTRAQDGFPNAGVSLLLNVDGISHLRVIEALTKIPKGTPVLYNYKAFHPTKMSGYLELDPIGRKTFLEGLDYADLTNLARKDLRGYASHSDKTVPLLYERFTYILGTPTILLESFFDGTLDIDKTIQVAKALKEKPFFQNERFLELGMELLTFLQRANRSPSIKAFVGGIYRRLLSERGYNFRKVIPFVLRMSHALKDHARVPEILTSRYLAAGVQQCLKYERENPE